MSRVILLTFILISGVILGEIWVRRTHPIQPSLVELDPQLGIRNRSHLSTRAEVPGAFSVVYHTDAKGNRKTVLPPMKTDKRIVVLGDSFAYGWGVEDHETFLSRMVGWGFPAKAINGAVMGTGLAYQYGTLKKHAKTWHPDYLVFSIFENDVEDDRRSGLVQLRKGKWEWVAPAVDPFESWVRQASSRFPAYDWLSSHSALFTWIRLQGTHWINGRKSEKRKERSLHASDWERTVGLMELLEGEARQLGARYVFLLIPDPREVSGAMSGTQMEAIRRHCHRRSLPCVDMLERFEGLPVGRFYLPKDGHWTPLAHELAARELLEVF